MIRRTYKKLIAMLVLFTLAAAPLAGCSVEPSVSFKEKNIEIYTFEEYPLEVDVKGGSADDIVWFSQSPKIAMVSGGKLIGLRTGESQRCCALRWMRARGKRFSAWQLTETKAKLLLHEAFEKIKKHV
jgi:hypothetical protein